MHPATVDRAPTRSAIPHRSAPGPTFTYLSRMESLSRDDGSGQRYVCWSSEPLLQSFRQHAGSTFVQQDHTATDGVRIKLNVAIALGDHEVGESA